MALSKEDATKKRNLMALGMTEAEALDVIECDHEIDRGIPQEFDLDPEREKMAKKFANSTTKKKAPMVLNLTKRERKPNATKGAVMAELFKFLSEQSENALDDVQLVNAEREIDFKIGEDSFTLVLTQKRKPKK